MLVFIQMTVNRSSEHRVPVCVQITVTSTVRHTVCVSAYRVRSVCGGGSPPPCCPPGRREVWSPPEQTSRPSMFVGSNRLYISAARSDQKATSVVALHQPG